MKRICLAYTLSVLCLLLTGSLFAQGVIPPGTFEQTQERKEERERSTAKVTSNLESGLKVAKPVPNSLNTLQAERERFEREIDRARAEAGQLRNDLAERMRRQEEVSRAIGAEFERYTENRRRIVSETNREQHSAMMERVRKALKEAVEKTEKDTKKFLDILSVLQQLNKDGQPQDNENTDTRKPVAAPDAQQSSDIESAPYPSPSQPVAEPTPSTSVANGVTENGKDNLNLPSADIAQKSTSLWDYFKDQWRRSNAVVGDARSKNPQLPSPEEYAESSVRAGGALQFVGGGLMTTACTAAAVQTAPTGIGPYAFGLCAAKGFDHAITGYRQFVTGESQRTAVYALTKDVTGSDRIATAVDIGTDFIALAPATYQGAKTLITKALQPKIVITPKIAGQMEQRGWSNDLIRNAIDKPYATSPAVNRATGNSATAYFTKEGAHSYVVRDNVTGQIVQVSNRLNRGFRPDRSITKIPAFSSNVPSSNNP